MCLRVDRDADQQVSVCVPTTDRMEQMDGEGNFSTPNAADRSTSPSLSYMREGNNETGKVEGTEGWRKG